MLCQPQYNDEEQVTGVGPSLVPTRCVSGCCGGSVQLQIRTRMAYGRAVLCAAFFDGSIYHTGRTIEIETKLWKTFPPPETLVRTCLTTETGDSGTAAVWTTSDPLAATACGGSEPVIETTPEDCLEAGDDWDDPRTQPAVVTYSGGTAVVGDLLGEAIGAMAWGEWSEWTTIGEIGPGGGAGLANLAQYLAEAGRGQSGSGPGAFAEATRYESELRIIGAMPVSVSISSGSGLLGDLPVTTHALMPGVPVLFSVAAPTEDEEWLTEQHVLRCACPLRFAPSSS